MNKLSKRKIIVLLMLAAVIAAGAYHYISTKDQVSTDDAMIEAHITPVSSKVAGAVVELNVIDNQHVRKGDVLLRIDSRNYEAALNEAKAQLLAAQARLIAGQHNFATTVVSAPSNLESAQSQVSSAQAELKNAQQTLKRLQNLTDAARSRQSLEDAVSSERQARANLESSKAQLKSAQTAPDAVAASQANVKELEAAVEQAQAAVVMAQNNLDDTEVVAAQDGRITRKNIELGAYVQPGQQMAALVSDDMWVIANFKETQLEGIKEGQSVDVEVDAYEGKNIKGKVDSVQSGTGARFSLFPPENATGNFVKIVQRVPVKIIFDKQPDEDLHIGPGMSVIPTVHLE